MSDWFPLADILKKAIGYTNTFLGAKPHLDITDDDYLKFPELDFLISCEVLEHVGPPIQLAFDNLAKMLKKRRSPDLFSAISRRS